LPAHSAALLSRSRNTEAWELQLELADLGVTPAVHPRQFGFPQKTIRYPEIPELADRTFSGPATPSLQYAAGQAGRNAGVPAAIAGNLNWLAMR
jgi:hypothetical protein